MAFPLLEVGDEAILAFRHEESFRKLLAMTTNAALKDGFFERARLIDANLVEHRVERLELAGREPFFGWLRRGRQIKELRLVRKGYVTLDEVKNLVTGIISRSEFWQENENVEELAGKIARAGSLSEIAEPFVLE